MEKGMEKTILEWPTDILTDEEQDKMKVMK